MRRVVARSNSAKAALFRAMPVEVRWQTHLDPDRRSQIALKRVHHERSVGTQGARLVMTGEQLAQAAKAWWYYTVELAPGVVAQGTYPADFPYMPRMLMRQADLRGADCLDLGSMEGVIPVLMQRKGAKRIVATDAVPHWAEKMALLQQVYGARWDFREVGLMYGLPVQPPPIRQPAAGRRQGMRLHLHRMPCGGCRRRAAQGRNLGPPLHAGLMGIPGPVAPEAWPG